MLVGVDARELQGRPTGTGRYLRNLLRVWPPSGRDRLVLYFNGPAPRDPLLDRPWIVRRALGDGSARGLVWQERLLPPAARADRVEVFFSPAYTCPLALTRPRVTTVHDLSFFSLPEDFSLREGLRRRLLVAASLRASRVILAVSDFTRREIAGRFPETADRVLHVPHGADDDLPSLPDRRAARERLRLEGPLILSVGSIFNRRRLPELLRAFALLTHPHPTVRLDLVGENRTHPRLDIPALVRRLGLTDHVRLSGFVSDEELAARHAAADAAVFLSDYEGFGLPALEAAARGLPLVVADRPAVGEIFREAALLVDPTDPGAIAAALDRALRDTSLRRHLVEAGRALAARHSWAAAAQATRDALARAASP
jgi:glycosyltransferase involved in cell wall biosynthesis